MEVVIPITLVVAFCLQYVLSRTAIDYMVGDAIQIAADSIAAEQTPAAAESSGYSYTRAGPPTRTSDGMMRSAIWCHSHFMKRNNPSLNEELSKKGRIAIKAAKIITNSTGSVEVTLRDHEIGKSFERQFAPICYKIPKCDPFQPYRNVDGTCNNLVSNVLWGASFTPLQRNIAPKYQDGLEAPRILGVFGGFLPSARDVSNAIHDNGFVEYVSKDITPFLTHFGQFLDHDIVSVPLMKGSSGENVEYCCREPNRPECFSIRVSPFDSRFAPRTCMHFVRSDVTPDFNCKIAPRQQQNQRTSFVDGTMIYGWDREKENTLRARNGGFLKVSKSHPPYPGLLTEGDDNSCMLEPGSPHCFDAGDHRHTEVPALTVIHTTFMRRHNRIAEHLQLIGISNDDEILFQEAKRIVIAELQHIVYNEFLPLVLDDRFMTRFGLKSALLGHNTVYRDDVNPSTSNSFATAAYRFGHSLVRNIFHRIPGIKHRLEDHFDRPLLIHSPVGCERFTRWMSLDGNARADAFVEDGLRNNLFKGTAPNDGISTDAFDLVALNIQRGRDHGLPGYNAFREWCGRPRAIHFGTGKLGLTDHDPQTAARLDSVYEHPDDIDLFAGGMSELVLPGSVLGPTFSCLIANQFSLYKIGDRFWYENNFPVTGFTSDQVNQIKRTTLAKIFCSTMNRAELDTLQPLLLARPGRGNSRESCDSILEGSPLGFDLGPWTDFSKSRRLDGIVEVSPWNPGMRGIITSPLSLQHYEGPTILPVEQDKSIFGNIPRRRPKLDYTDIL